ncbi:MAG: LamG domain-containing protein, partial [Limisphaerales bacterium]
MVCGNNLGAGQYLIVPRKTNGVFNAASTIQAPFTIEAWLLTTTSTSGLRPIITQGRNSIMGDSSVGYNNTFAGFGLGQYQGFFYFQLYCTNANANGGPELDMRGIAPNTWYHVAVTFDGTTETMYSNGVYVTSATATMNAAGLRYVPDMVNPLIIGSGNDLSAQTGGTEFSGDIAEVAIYPTVLTQEQLANHYAAGAGASDAYASTISADGPSYYFRLDEPALTTYPDPTSYPVANNTGALGAVGNGAYQPGTTPGVAGPTYSGFGASSHAVSINGFFGAVEIGASNLPAALNPTGTSPLTVAAWFRSTADSRFQEIVSHGDASWRLSFNGNNGSSSTAPWDVHFNPGAGAELGGANLADVLTNG